ncbi:MAG TPA: 3'-5' exonuclease [Xanthobacteraceae bacterium]|nr:3'-5' exonuclease [Xanthobacteraceae bacterium]
MISLFHQPWIVVPSCWIDCETTGTRPGTDRPVQIAIVRFEDCKEVGAFWSLVNPGMPIPAEATAIHGITDEQVAGAPSVADVFALPKVRELLKGAQPAAYNAPFDRHFVPPFGEDWTWPWLDALSIVRVVDRFVKGKGRHRLELTAQRHGIPLGKAHDALDDARAAGSIFYKLAPLHFRKDDPLGHVLRWQRQQEAEEWFRFMDWRAKQPPIENKEQSL